MNSTSDIPPEEQPPPARERRSRLPSLRASVALGAAMLAIGVGVGAAIGPAPDVSYAGGASALATRLPVLLAGLVSRDRAAASSQASTTATTPAPAIMPQATPEPASTAATTPASTTTATTPAVTKTSPKEEAAAPTESKTSKSKLPAVTNVWLIELAGTSFTEALAQPTAAPYITGQLIPQGTLLSAWSAAGASAFASESVLAEPPAAGAVPPLLHTIVQPPCPEGAAGASCAIGTPGQLTAADEFLKATLATITGTPLYKEHGLIVVTFATIAVPTQAGLPAGSSSATLTYKPPAGAALLSPFVHAGARSTVTFNPTSPRQSLEKLLH
jgi:hypothetical protein